MTGPFFRAARRSAPGGVICEGVICGGESRTQSFHCG